MADVLRRRVVISLRRSLARRLLVKTDAKELFRDRGVRDRRLQPNLYNFGLSVTRRCDADRFDLVSARVPGYQIVRDLHHSRITIPSQQPAEGESHIVRVVE